jgi:hypothetical protein
VELRGDVQLLRSDPMMRNAADEQPPFGWWEFWKAEPEDDRDARTLRRQGVGTCAVGLVKPQGAFEGPTLLLSLQSRYLLVSPDEFSRTATVVGQVDVRPRGADERVVIRDRPNETALAAESTDAEMEELSADQLAAGRVFDSPRYAAPANERAAFVRNAVVLKPLCIYKARDYRRAKRAE